MRLVAPFWLGPAVFLVASGAAAQHGMPSRPAGPGSPHGAPTGTDCAVTAIDIVIRPHRIDALVDVAVRIRADKGGQCLFRAEGAQISTAKGGLVTRALGELWVDDKILQPVAVADAPGADRLRPWTGRFSPKEEHVLVARQYLEGDVGPSGDVDPPSKLRAEMRNLGPHVFEGAPLTVKVLFPAGTKAKVTFHSGNPKTMPTTHAVDAGGAAEIVDKLTTDDLAATIDWKVEGELPAAATPGSLNGGLAVLEYLRDGMLRDFSAHLAAAGNDEKKVAAAWDQVIDVSYSAAKAHDPILAAMGVRALAYFASGLSPAATAVKADGQAGEGVTVPAVVANELTKQPAAFLAQTGQRIAPSPIGSRSARALFAKIDGPSRKKEADEAFKRLAKRIEKNQVVALRVGDVFTTSPPVPKVGPGAPATAKVIVWGPNGPMIGVPPHVAGHAAKRPFVSRAIHAITGLHHRKTMLRAIFAAGMLAAIGAAIAALYRGDKREDEDDRASAT